MGDIVRALKQAIEAEMLSGVTELYVEQGGGEMDVLRNEVSSCKACQLAQTRNNVVFGEGSTGARLMFVGEAPGRDEDLKAMPFVGRAGKLLTKIIESIGLERKDVYIANILKCRPPDNRNPLPGEIEKCLPNILRQIEIINPVIICALGKFAAQTLLETETSISALRGKFHDYGGIKLMPTYHPAYLLRNPAAKKEVWQDMKLIARELDLKIPAK
jgi:uracil-DNA glycosylase